MTPASLNKGEMEFIEDLKNYWSANECTFMKMFVLRNLARGNGIGFFDLDTFYPDFILWLEYEKNKLYHS